MGDDRRPGSRPRRVRVPAAVGWWTLLAVPLLVGLLAATTPAAQALFTSSTPVGANLFTAETVDVTATPAATFLTLSQMGPGDVITAPITITNSGPAQLRYAVTSTTSEDALAGQLDMYIRSGVTTCTNAGFTGSGVVIYNNASHLGTTAGVNLVGNPAYGSHAGDRVLSAGFDETLCFQVSMPTSIANSYQGLSDTVTFSFHAEQTVHN